jgi:hypothetical protein
VSDPIIHLTHQAEVKLTAWSIATHGREFSGLGLIEKEGYILHVVDVDLLGVGSLTYTEFGFERQRLLPPDPRRKLWLHRHPLGNGKPGPHNWSGRDNRTAELEPFGVPSQLVQWSCSIVLTPKGWVGRVDFYLPTLRTFHCAVEPNLPSEQVVIEASALIDENLRRFIDDLLQEFEAQQRAGRTYVHHQYTDGDFDVFNKEDEEDNGLYCQECDAPLSEDGEVHDLVTGNALPAFSCLYCGNIYVLTDHVPAPKPAWKQSSWWNRMLGGK